MPLSRSHASRVHPTRPPKKRDRMRFRPYDPVLRSLGQQIQTARLATGMSQRATAEKLRISVAYMSLIEQGGRNPPATLLLQILQALAASPDALLTDPLKALKTRTHRSRL